MDIVVIISSFSYEEGQCQQQNYRAVGPNEPVLLLAPSSAHHLFLVLNINQKKNFSFDRLWRSDKQYPQKSQISKQLPKQYGLQLFDSNSKRYGYGNLFSRLFRWRSSALWVSDSTRISNIVEAVCRKCVFQTPINIFYKVTRYFYENKVEYHTWNIFLFRQLNSF